MIIASLYRHAAYESDALCPLLMLHTTGLCSISPEFLVIDSGFVSDITAAGDIIVAGRTVRLNDPVGVFGPAQRDADPLWGVDIANPSVRTSTGFPHCIPSSTSTWCTVNGRTRVNLGTKVANEQQFLDLQVDLTERVLLAAVLF
jgi:hypothetical protein